MSAIEIPFSELSDDILKGVIEEFVSREGTDYGHEFSLEDKVNHVLKLLHTKRVVIMFDTESESCNIVTK